MRLLLDTHALLWSIADPGRLDTAARDTIADDTNVVLVSAASQWEISIKRALGKLAFDDSIAAHAEANRFTPLPITMAHAETAGALPPLHGDPFDRMLVAQAQLENAVVVTRDPMISRYDVPTLAA